MKTPRIRVAPSRRGSFKSIQQAILGARGASEIWIEPGQYVESLYIDRPVRLVAPDRGVTIATRVRSALTMAASEASAAGIEFQCWDPEQATIRAGYGNLNLSECSVWAATGPALDICGGALIAHATSFTSDQGIGIAVSNGGYLATTGCLISRCHESGIKVADGTINLESTHISECGGNGLYLCQSVTGRASQCDFSACNLPLVFLGTGARVELHRCNLHDSSSSGVYGDSRSSPVVTECHFRALRGTGSEAVTASKEAVVRVNGGSIRNCTRGLGANGGRLEATGTVIESADIGISVADGGNIDVRGCTVRAPQITGIRCFGGACRVDAVTIDAHECAGSAVVVDEGAELMGQRLHIDGGLDGGLLVKGTAAVDHCHISRPKAAGISVEAGGRLTAVDLMVSEAGDGILVGEGSLVRLTRCEVIDSATDGVRAWAQGARVIGRELTIKKAARHGLVFAAGGGGDIDDSAVVGCGGDGVCIDDRSAPTIGRIDIKGQGGVTIRRPLHVVARAGRPPGIPGRPPAARAGTARDRRHDMASLLGELNQLVGLDAVKRDVADMASFIELERRQQAAGLVAEPIGRHLVFAGPPGTGKNTVARLYANLLAAAGVLPEGRLTEVSRADLVSEHIGGTAQLTTERFMAALGGVLFIDEAYTLVHTGSAVDFGAEAINTLVKLMEDHRSEVVVIVAGYTAQMERFLSANPGLASRFTKTIHFDSYTVDELIEIFRRRATALGLRYDEGVIETVQTVLAAIDRGPSFGNAREVRELVDRARVAMARRLAGRQDISPDALITLVPEDFGDLLPRRIGTPGTRAVAALRAELDEMVGLGGVKRQVGDLIDVLQLQAQQRARGIPTPKISPHLVFAGSPGTGKTTVARQYGRILSALGLLRDGHVVEASRADLVAGYIGQTAIKTAEKFAEARGGILLIDEAYALVARSGSFQDFGIEAINTLVKLMEDHRSDVVVIAAGYTDEMRDFLATNPGLESRFSKTIVFDDYSDAELVEICHRLAAAEGKRIEPEAEPILLHRIAIARTAPNFGNVRFARRLLEEANVAMARRLQGSGQDRSLHELTTITAGDLRNR